MTVEDKRAKGCILLEECERKFSCIYKKIDNLSKTVYIGVGIIVASEFFLGLILLIKE